MHLISLILPLALLQGAIVPPKLVPQKPEPGKVMAKVDGVEIRASEVETLLWDWRAREVVEDLIVYRQISAEAEKAKVKVSDAEVEKGVQEMTEQYRQRLQPGQELDEMLRSIGMPKSRMFLRAKVEKLLDKIAEAEFKPEGLVRVSTLIVKPRSESASDVAEAIKKADLAYQRLNTGEKWEQVLASVSDDPNLLRNNGFLGWRTIEAFPAATRDELATLKTGQVTKPVQTPNGIQLFRLELRGQEAKGDDLQSLRNSFVSSARQRVLDRIRSGSKVEKFQ